MRRAACALGALALALAAGGCGGNAPGPGGINLSVYSVLPMHGARAAIARDLLDGQKLALRDAGGRVGGFTISFKPVDTAPAGAVTSETAAQAARQAAADLGTIAATGAFTADEARVELPLLNQAGVPLLTPVAGYAGLTHPVPGVTATGEPERFYPYPHRTFGRLVGDDSSQARAIAVLARRSRCRSLGVAVGEDAGDGSLAELVARAMPARVALGLGEARRVGRGGCLLLAASDPVAAARAARSSGARIVIAPAALVDPAFTGALGRVAARTRLVSPVGRDLPAPARRVAARFQQAFGRPAGPYALLGYQAMQDILGAVRRAGARGGDRATVTARLDDGRVRPTLLGPRALEPDGEVAPARWYAATVRAGRAFPGTLLT